jgi:hypothetical protein
MTIRISISCEPDEIDEVRRLLAGFVTDGIKASCEMLDRNGGLTDPAKRDILIRYDEGEPIRDIANDLGVDGRLISGLVLGTRKSPNCPHNKARKCMLREGPQ